MDGFIDNDISDDSDDFDFNSFDEELENRKPKLTSALETKLKNYRNIIKEKTITYDKILKAKLSEDETIWFIEYLDILDNLDKYTEEYYKIKTLIYNKYKEIQKEKINQELLDKIKKIVSLDEDLLNKIYHSKHSDYIKAILYKKFKSIQELDKTDEYFKVIDWIDNVLEIPTEIIQIREDTGNKKEITDMIINLKNTLNSKLYGLDNVKERILEFYCAMINNPFYKKKFIALVGPPGVGKTMLAKSIAESMNLPYDQLSFGSIKDASVLTGHSSTYIGSRPGLFVNILKKTKVLNPVILLDEIDKINHSQEGLSINSVLLHILDNTQNKRFQDMYMPEIHLDLSNIFFILALNNLDNVDPILKDRIHVIKIDGYNLEEKIKIGKKFILPKVLENLMFKKNDIIINDKTMMKIISKKCHHEHGVRELEKSISTICEKINVLKYIKDSSNIQLSYKINNLKFPYEITETDVETFL